MALSSSEIALLKKLLAQNLDIAGRRVIMAGDSIGNQDYVTQKQLNDIGIGVGFGKTKLIYVTDEVYGSGWDSDLEPPTKNAAYDKIQTLLIGNALFDHYANAGNVTTGETDLYSDTIAAGQLSANGDKLEAEYGGVFVSSGTATREIKIYFGGTVIFDTGALTLSLSSAWTTYVTIQRVSTTVVRYMISFTTEGAALAAYTSVGELTGLTLSNTNILKITGQAAGVGAATNDIIAKLSHVTFLKAA